MNRNNEGLSIGIIGAGVVGSALVEAFRGKTEILIRDPKLEEDSCSIGEIVAKSVAIFIAVPTPAGEKGAADCSIISGVIEELASTSEKLEIPRESTPVICINSAVPPDVIANLVDEYPQLRIVVIPEFMREASPVEDIMNLRSLVLGGDYNDCSFIVDLYKEHSNIRGEMRTAILRDAIAASFLKYQENCFLALKVSFMNEFFEVFSKCGSKASWEELQLAFHQDHERMGSTHWQVPGPDGLRGWGGRCLPKDTLAFRAYAEELGIEIPIMEAAMKRNERDRINIIS
ncbi:hypothetical protein ACFLX8_04800 [Chloroflexota bacterium]